MKKPIDRRLFVKGAALTASSFTILPRHVLGGKKYTAPSDKLNIAGIGVGGMGKNNLKQMQSENIVALCDVDDAYAAPVFREYPKAKIYRDYRVMLEKQKDIDAVLIATPDHTHGVIAMAAIEAGKHIYCQKPLTHSVYEARKVTEAARKANIVTQMGNQGHSDEGVRLVCEWIWDGAIGDIREVDVWCTLSFYPFGHAGWSSPCSEKPTDTPPVPSTLDWELWLGPAKYRPYSPCYHPLIWRTWWDFGVGMMGDRGAHTLDAPYWALKLGHPDSIEAFSTNVSEDTYPVASLVTYHFPARENLPPVTLRWYDGMRPSLPEELEDGRVLGDSEGGVIFHGSRGKLMCGTYNQSPRLIPESKMREYKQPAPTLPRINGTHEGNWIDSCKKGVPATSNFDYAGPLTEIVLLGNIAKRMNNQRLHWDGENMKVTNVPEANQYVRHEYRKGWVL